MLGGLGGEECPQGGVVTCMKHGIPTGFFFEAFALNPLLSVPSVKISVPILFFFYLLVL